MTAALAALAPPLGAPPTAPAALPIQQINFRHPGLFYPGQSEASTGRTGCTVLLYGPFGSIKTTWAGMWPRTLFISAGQEGGERALEYMPVLYGLPIPPVVRINSTTDMFSLVNAICSNYVQMGICTVVVDSVTYLQKRWLYERLALRYGKALGDKMFKEGALDIYTNKRDWGLIASDFQHWMVRLHSTPLNILWIATEKPILEEDEKGNQRPVALAPNIKGEFLDTLIGGCKLVIHADRQMRHDPKVPGKMYAHPVFETSPTWMTKSYVRHRFGPAFPEGQLIDPRVGDWPTFGALASRIPQAIYGLQ